MEYKEILNFLAPCGLSCRKCMANSEGDIKKSSAALKRQLGNFDKYAERFSSFIPVFKNYPVFKEMLDFFITADCRGCRQGDCKYPHCGVAACFKEKKMDFCFQCDEFPCEKTNFDPDLKKRWLKMNMRMKEVGVEKYFEETKNKCRYE